MMRGGHAGNDAIIIEDNKMKKNEMKIKCNQRLNIYASSTMKRR